MNNLQKLNHVKLTENGDIAFDTTGDNLLDILFMSAYYEKHLDEVRIGNSDKDKLFARFIRDPRFGLGRRDLGRVLMAYTGVKPEDIVKSGRFDDLLITASDEDLEYWKKQIEAGNALAKKWAPRLTGKDKYLAKLLAKHWGMSEKEYRAFIKTDSTVEYKLSYSEEWHDRTNALTEAFDKTVISHPLVNTINFEQVPSLAMIKYYKAFEEREDTKERFLEYVDSVKKGTRKLNVSTTNVYDIYRNRIQIDPDLFFDKLEKINISCVPVVDTSGSMTLDDAMGKALSIGHYLGKCTSFCNGYVVSFSSRPQLMKIEGSNYEEEIESLYTGDCSNTDLGKVMELFTNMKEVPEYLIILSDMEFDQGSRIKKDKLMQLWKEKGYTTKIVWWNFNGRAKTAPETDDYGNIFLSGYNPMLLKFLEAGFDGKAFLDKLLEEYENKLKTVK